MDLCVNGSRLGGTVAAIPSKSQAHRLLLCAALAEGESRIRCPQLNADIEATARCLRALGAEIEREGEDFLVRPVPRDAGGPCLLDCGESGSTLRFLLPVAAALGRKARFVGSGRLPERPLAELCGALRSGGAALSADRLPITVSGGLRAGTYRLPAKVSSQYISGLLFALPLLGGESRLELDGNPESAPYIAMTLAALRTFGVGAVREGNAWRVPAGQRYRSPGALAVEGDWSNAAFWLCAGAVGHAPLTVTGLDPASPQGDRAVLDLLLRFGAAVEAGEDCVTVSPAPLHGAELDARDVPDLIPVLSVVAACAAGETRVVHAGRLRLKESDRLSSTAALLRSLGGAVTELEDGLVIHGGGLTGGCVDSFRDHRIAMAAAAASAACPESVTIRGAEAVNKSYPAFFAHYRALGGLTREAEG